MSKFKKGSRLAKEAAKKGAVASVAARREKARIKALAPPDPKQPYTGSIVDVMGAAGIIGWLAWRAFLKAVFALPMSDEELAIYRRHTERDVPPETQVAEGWLAIGRRGGKTRIAAMCAHYLAIRFDASPLAPGEVAVIPLIAADRKQARQMLGYLRGFCALPEFSGYVKRQLKEAVEYHTGVIVEIHSGTYRATRGYTCPAVICDEVAFWYSDEASANPDSEILGALRPAMSTIPDALLLGLSSPYAAKGELYKAVERSFGKADPHVLVWNADTRSMNTALPERVVARAFEEDPVAAASEYGQDGRVQFRRDVEVFLDPVAVRAVTITGRLETAPQEEISYRAFVDPSGGSQDSFTLAIAHTEGDLAVLDAVRERRPPFSPEAVVGEFAALLRTYRVSEVTGDRYGGEWPREVFRKAGITYTPSDLTKSDIYRELLPAVNAGRVALLDIPTLRGQLVGLERRVARGGRDSIDHAPGGRDDVANAAAGALVLSLSGGSGKATDFSGLTSLGSDAFVQASPWAIDVVGGSAGGGGSAYHAPTPLDLGGINRRRDGY